MLNILGARQHFCDGINRRSFLKIGAFGAGLALSDMLRLQAKANGSSKPSKAAIMIFLPGGPSHLDMYDMKPEAPAEYRGEFKPITTNVAGIQICELMPRQAQMMDKLAIIRSLVSVGEHSDAEVMTGYSENVNRTAHHPSFGSVLSRLRDNGQSDIPTFVSLRGQSIGCEPGYLGVANRAFTPDGQGLSNLSLNGGLTMERASDRRSLLEQFDTVRRDIDATGTMRGLDAFAARAFDMIASGATRRALDLNREEPRVRDRYRGIEQFLTARRLIEAGVGCVTLAYGGWDTHSENFKTLRRQLPELDRGVANLIHDLHERGMADDVVTVVWGEFGRTPRIGDSTPDGRGHWPAVMSAVVAGGGLKMGQAIGSSNARGEQPRERRCSPSQLLSTIYQAIGVDPSQTFPNNNGRPMYVLDDRQPISELL
jgi:uncharacterized protein (DUF1501 family)